LNPNIPEYLLRLTPGGKLVGYLPARLTGQQFREKPGQQDGSNPIYQTATIFINPATNGTPLFC